MIKVRDVAKSFTLHNQGGAVIRRQFLEYRANTFSPDDLRQPSVEKIQGKVRGLLRGRKR